MKLFKTYSERELKRIAPLVDMINGLEAEVSKLSDKELRAKTSYFKEELKKGKTLDDILPESFAVVREASKRVLGMRHFDVQLIGGIILHQGRIAEMKTGEGKTLVATLPAYLNALEEKGTHVITVNDYLAKRDSEWMGKLYKFLGLTVGLVHSGLQPLQKQKQYSADITYGTNNEFGFDYLRDNMVIYKDQLVQRGTSFAIIDEIDSILVDEARTPLIISGRGNASSDLYRQANDFVRRLTAKIIVEEDVKDLEQAEDNENYDYVIDLKAKSASLTQKGVAMAEQMFKLENFNDLENSTLVHHVNQALRANGVMKSEVDYIVKNGEVLIVDEFTGRIMNGRRYNNGLHQAIEAKEGVKVADESRTLATITFQNYFRMYNKLSGMTGTAMTEKDEFQEIYNLDVIEIPTNKELKRSDNNDVIYKNENGKFRAIVESVKESVAKGQPVLIGTVSIEKSEKLSKLLSKASIKHNVLNAKYHEKEAEIVAQAGKFGAVTIATNMAGRGTDIMLGGNSEYLAKEQLAKLKYTPELIEEANSYYETEDEEILKAREEFKTLVSQYEEKIKEEKVKVIEAGGLKIIGTERHESRRIDNQLRGRAGRQGDVGETKFYMGLDDDLMKLFGGSMLDKVYATLGADEDMPIENMLISKTVENAQKKVEGRNFSVRKNVLKYDDVMNVQRNIIYSQRKQVLNGEDLHNKIENMITEVANATVFTFVEANGGVTKEALHSEIFNQFGFDFTKEINENQSNPQAIADVLAYNALEKYNSKATEVGSDQIRELERVVMLKVVDEKWMEHIDDMDELKNGIGLRAYGQQDPAVKYRTEGADMFDEMINYIKTEVVKLLMNMRSSTEAKRQETVKIAAQALKPLESVDGGASIGTEVDKTIKNDGPKIGRNEPCYCGSGKKYKHCHGRDK